MDEQKREAEDAADGQCESPGPVIKTKKTNNIFETDIDRKSNFVKIFQLLLPFVLASIFIILTYLFFRDSGRVFGLVAAYYVPPSGKESIIPIATSLGIHPLAISLAITASDVLFCLFLIWNASYVKKVPYVGWAFTATETMGRKLAERYKSFKNLEFLALIMFIAFPLRGSGGIVGTLMGIIIGMNPYKILAAMLVGTFLSTIFLAYFSNFIWEHIPLSFPETLLFIVLFIEVLVVIRLVYGYFSKRRKEKKSRC